MLTVFYLSNLIYIYILVADWQILTPACYHHLQKKCQLSQLAAAPRAALKFWQPLLLPVVCAVTVDVL